MDVERVTVLVIFENLKLCQNNWEGWYNNEVINTDEIIKTDAYISTRMKRFYFETNLGAASFELDEPKSLLELILDNGLSLTNRKNTGNLFLWSIQTQEHGKNEARNSTHKVYFPPCRVY